MAEFDTTNTPTAVSNVLGQGTPLPIAIFLAVLLTFVILGTIGVILFSVTTCMGMIDSRSRFARAKHNQKAHGNNQDLDGGVTIPVGDIFTNQADVEVGMCMEQVAHEKTINVPQHDLRTEMARQRDREHAHEILGFGRRPVGKDINMIGHPVVRNEHRVFTGSF